jgi:hypothetical protein
MEHNNEDTIDLPRMGRHCARSHSCLTTYNVLALWVTSHGHVRPRCRSTISQRLHARIPHKELEIVFEFHAL